MGPITKGYQYAFKNKGQRKQRNNEYIVSTMEGTKLVVSDLRPGGREGKDRWGVSRELTECQRDKDNKFTTDGIWPQKDQ